MTFRDDVRTVGDALADWVEASRAARRPAIRQRTISQIVHDYDVPALMREGGLSGSALRRFVEAYLDDATALHHPAFMAHQVAVPSLTGALAGLMDGVSNNAMSVYEMGPSSSALEYCVINWMLAKVGWTPAPLDVSADSSGDHGGGVLTHGGSLANLTALIAARNRAFPEAWELGSPPGLALLLRLAPLRRSVAIALRRLGGLGLLRLKDPLPMAYPLVTARPRDGLLVVEVRSRRRYQMPTCCQRWARTMTAVGTVTGDEAGSLMPDSLA